MATEASARTAAWALFDQIVAVAAPGGMHTNPWRREADGRPAYHPDFDVLRKLLGVPLQLKAGTNTGVPALALDVWLSYELRRAGFDTDAVWPRPVHPRVLPRPVANLLSALPVKERQAVEKRLAAGAVKGVVGSSANMLGKNYVKQVDVVMSDWDTGPELMISTKRMDSSFGKNAANRVEESYGDAKNLRLRHPMAALGFVYGLRSTILTSEPNKAEWLIDLLQKLGREDDAYHAVALVMIEYDIEIADESDGSGVLDTDAEDPAQDALFAVDVMPPQHEVVIRHDEVPAPLQPAAFLEAMVARVLDATPVARHREARRRRESATGS